MSTFSSSESILDSEDASDMIVMKRSGQPESISFDKILRRIKKIGSEVGIKLNYTSLAMKVIDQLYNNISTTKIDELAAEHCAVMSSQHTDYGILAGRIVVSNHQKNTSGSFCDITEQMYLSHENGGARILNTEYYNVVCKHGKEIEEMIDYNRDYLIDYFGFKTLERSYLFKLNDVLVERPQHMWMRVSIAIHGNDLDAVRETYDLMSQKYFTHATPTLFNAGTQRQQMSSCYLIAMEEDSLDGIFNTLHDCARISKWAGGIGLHIHNIRSNKSLIKGTNGLSHGIVPMLKVFNDTARFINQGGKRNGSFAIYIEPWHADIEEFLEMKKNHGDDEMRARDLFYGLWIPDLFMKKVENNEEWCLFCPDKCRGLSDAVGDEFETLYSEYEKNNMYNRRVSARELWYRILDSQMETGTPYLLYKDACNRKSNQQNLGVIKSSNLCTEIVQHSDEKETAVCNLASIGLPTFVDAETKTFDYGKLHEVTKVITKNLNNIIDFNFYPTEKTEKSNQRHRPIGIGVQGLADTFVLMDIAFYSDEAKEVNKHIFETIYHGAMERSYELAKQHGAYETFVGSPLQLGKFQFDLWGVEPSDRYDWEDLRNKIKSSGVRNSLLVAPMPTASTSQILGFNECFEPFTSNLYSRRTLAGEFVVANKYLMKELIDLGIWDEKVKNHIIANKGSIQQLEGVSQKLKDKYKIVWEMPMRHIIDMSADRGAFICQSQSMNLWVEKPTYKTLTSMHFYSWKKGLKTGLYYLRRKASHHAQQFTIEPTKKVEPASINEEVCEMCSA